MSRLGELLLRDQLISPEQLELAQEESRKSGERIGHSLVKLGAIQEENLTHFLSRQYGVPAINLAEFEIESTIIELVPKDVAARHRVIPVSRSGQALIVAMADPSNILAIDDLKFLTGYNIEVVVASDVAIDAAVTKYYEPKKSFSVAIESLMNELEAAIEIEAVKEEDIKAVDLEKMSEDAPVIRLTNHILMQAIDVRASDIHIEPYEKSYRVRLRTDGVLREIMQIPIGLKAALSSRVKIMSQLDIAERRLPQDGRIKLKIAGGREMDFRVSVLPTLFGEKIVMRLLDKGNLQLDMTKLGFETDQLKEFKDAIKLPYGMMLVTGPTGSGKTTTLYSALQELNTPDENISTAEDPVEFNLPGINQVQMHEEIGLNFAAALRSFLRQDPDTIMIGEIRDFETAEIAVKAALTGHRVLSTLHTNDAPSTITRLLNMGIEPFLVTASVNLVEAQRLVRKVCSDCKEEVPTPKDRFKAMGAWDELIDTAQFYMGHGRDCKTCGGSGYKGRLAVYEILTVKEPLKELVLQGASAAEIKVEAVRLGMKTLRMSALIKVAKGATTLDEVMRVTAGD
ncbi:MAG: type IV-A pilus assembly ATPase PilB [Myxococcales bacterium]|nr:type IV-A pilus assembly ATPase PilB [Myxococcales bacterium]